MQITFSVFIIILSNSTLEVLCAYKFLFEYYIIFIFRSVACVVNQINMTKRFFIENKMVRFFI